MKILHTSDLHLNSAMNTKLSGEKSRERRRELLFGFRKMTEYARQEACRAIIIAGDLFDSDRPSATARKYVIDVIEASSDILFFYLPGNHEKRVLEESEELPKNLYVFGDDWTSFAVGDIFITGRGTTDKNMFDSLKLPEGAPVVAVLHGELRDRCDEGGIIGRREIEKSHVSYLALGHYHSYSSEMIGSTVAVYSGAPESRGFDEIGEKGFVIIDTECNMSHRFVRGFGRGIHSVSIDCKPGLSTIELENLIAKSLGGISKTDLVRARLTGHRAPEDRFDIPLIEKHIRDRFYYFEIKDETAISISKDDYVNDKSLKGEFIRLVLSDDTLDEHQKDRIISCGLAALMGEKIDE